MRYVHTNLIVHDLEAMIAFYCEVMGCEVASRRDLAAPWLGRGAAIADAKLTGAHLRLPGGGDDGPTLELFAYDPPGEDPGPGGADRRGFGHLAFAVDDVAAARARVLAHGGRPVGEVVTGEVADVGQVTWTYVRDPEGNLLELQRWA